MPRKKISTDVKQAVLHQAGYKCANPACRGIITLDIHHLVYVTDDGKNDAENLLALCPNCHSLHHKGIIPGQSIRTWKMLLLAINEAFDRRSADILLTLADAGHLFVAGEGVLKCAPLIAGGFVRCARFQTGPVIPSYQISLTDKGTRFVKAWKDGKQKEAISPDN